MTPTPAVSTVGPPELLVFLVPERDTAVAAVTSGYVNKGFVDELHGYPVYKKRTWAPEGAQKGAITHARGCARR